MKLNFLFTFSLSQYSKTQEFLFCLTQFLQVLKDIFSVSGFPIKCFFKGVRFAHDMLLELFAEVMTTAV